MAASEQSQQAELTVSSGEELQSNVRLFTMLQARLNQRTSDLHILLREIREKRTCQDSYSMQMHDGWVEYSWSQVLPFHVLATVNALWGIVESGGSRRNLVSRVFGRSQDVYKITSRHALSNAAATVDSHSLIKRYFAPQNFVLVAESKSEHCGGAGAWRNTTEESVWCAVRQIPSRSTNEQVSVFQLKAVVRSQKYSSLDYAGNYVRDIIDIQRQYLENALLDSLRDGQTN
ncbi:hypothetical protein DVH05_026157 [Phytophthora capsici]|nr:hypothetical protein DVH05_026157 [Phytophthora capsici]